METDWSKVLEVFFSGIIGVFLVMILLQVLTQLSTKVIDVVESWNKADEPAAELKQQVASAKNRA